MCGGCAPATGINSPPKGGRIKTAPPGLQPAPKALLDGGRYAPPAPQGCAPCAPFGARVPAVCRPGRMAVQRNFFKSWAALSGGGVWGGVPPSDSGAVGNPARRWEPWATRQGCPRFPRAGRVLSTAERATGHGGRGCFLEEKGKNTKLLIYIYVFICDRKHCFQTTGNSVSA